VKRVQTGILNTKAKLVCDSEYHQCVRLLCLKARRRIYVSMFIVELLPGESAQDDTALRPSIIVELLEDLRHACLRGIDVRLVIGGAEQNIRIQDETEAALAHCRKLQIPCRLAALHPKKSSHKKIVVADDFVLTGSHNWSYGAFSGQTQDSVLIQDPRLASYFASSIARQWRLLEREGYHETI
jgi:phosphatidylserine/phosphatidylglycerophosphate/cardiolipin synthase-like enzyme